MSTYRYSGEIRIRVTYSEKGHIRNGYYRCHLTGPGNMSATIIVGAPAFLSHGVDSPEAFDEAAHAAISFADHDKGDEDTLDDSDWSPHAAFSLEGSDWHIGRSLATAWPKDESAIVNKSESPIVEDTTTEGE